MVVVRILLLVLVMTCLGCNHIFDCLAVGQAEIYVNSSVISDRSVDLHVAGTNPAYTVLQKVLCGRRKIFVRPMRRENNDNVDFDDDIQDDPHLDKILGGTSTYYGEFPWMANVQHNMEEHCGGAIISEFWVISAAHCYYDFRYQNIRVIVGDHNLFRQDWKEVIHKVAKIIHHGSFWPEHKNHDIALLKIQPDQNGRGIQFNDYVQPICLPEFTEDYPTDTTLLFSGFGDTDGRMAGRNPVVLMKTYLPIVKFSKCQDLYNSVTQLMFCAGFVRGSTDLCKGDSGGPAVYKFKGIFVLIGVASFGKACFGFNDPSVFTSIARYRRWIDSLIKGQCKGRECIMPSRS